ncbi:MAG: NTP transferase domain-containing protein [Ardenticatenales bacterium]|nr:NTP transferase domain-containing protein [Ardenticatenales bacterium]
MLPNQDRYLTGVILAAGRGTRLRPLSLHYPKPLLPVCNKPIIQYQLEDMKRIGVQEVFIVVGHLKEEMPRHLDRIGEALGMTLHYIDQGETLGIAHAVLQLEARLENPFILFLGDILMHAPRLEQMAELFWQRRAGAVLAVMREHDPEMIRRNFAVILHNSGLVTRVIEKPRFATTKLKGCGIYLFDLAVFDAIRRTPRTAQRDEYEITNSIQILIDDGYPVYPAEVVEWDMNVTFACDILDVNARMLAALNQQQLIGENVYLHPEVTLGPGVVIGDHVRVEAPAHIEDSVIFAGSVVHEGGTLLRHIITPGDRLVCPPPT